MTAYRTASADLLWILDSNMLVHPGSLTRAVAFLDPPPPSRPAHRLKRRIGLVHHVPVAVLPTPSPRLGSLLEYCFLNGNHARQYVVLNAAALASCLVGKSNLFFRSDLELATRLHHRPSPAERSNSQPEFVALETFAQFLGEDNMIGQTLWDELGLRHAIVPDFVGNVVGEYGLYGYVSRRVRWIRVRKYMSWYVFILVFRSFAFVSTNGAGLKVGIKATNISEDKNTHHVAHFFFPGRPTTLSTLVEPLTECLLLGLITSRCLNQLLDSFSFLHFFLPHLLLYLSLDYTVFKSLHTLPLSSAPTSALGTPCFIYSWLLRELLAFPIWVLAFWGGDGVRWRKGSEEMKVTRDGKAVRVR